MKIILSPQGSYGDARPLLALGLALRSAGYQIEICGPPNFNQLYAQYDFTFYPIGSDTQKIAEEQNELMGRPIQGAKFIVRNLRETISERFLGLMEAVHGADLLVVSGMDSAGRSVAEYLGIPFLYVFYVPLPYPSKQAFEKLPGWMNQLIWWGSKQVMNQVLGNTLQFYRQKLGLAKVENVMDFMIEKGGIVAADSALAPIPVDIRPMYMQTGYWPLEEEMELEEGLQRFIEAGPPPVYIGFGSMTDPAPAKTAKLLQELIDSRLFRVIISKGWAQLGVNRTGEHVCFIDYAPHAKLFPKMGVAVHHGGSGTTHTAARAGVPQIIIPHMGDQYYWAGRIAALRLGPKPIRRFQLSSRNLKMAILEAMTNPEIQKNAKKMGELLGRKDGLQEALKIIAMHEISRP